MSLKLYPLRRPVLTESDGGAVPLVHQAAGLRKDQSYIVSRAGHVAGKVFDGRRAGTLLSNQFHEDLIFKQSDFNI